MKYKKIESIAALRKAATNSDGGYSEFFISLGGGMLRSSKQISYSTVDETFCIINEIDDTFQEDLTEEDLKLETNIYDAIESGGFYQYIFNYG
jgi:hypothetical protein